MTLKGKGFFTWRLEATESGNSARIAAFAKAASLTHVLIKIADGIVSTNIDLINNIDYALLVSQALRAQGIQVWGWHYVYGDSPVVEASRALQRIRQLDLDGYVVNAEVEYKKPGRGTAARRYMEALRAGCPDLPIGLSSYRYPSLHRAFPWREFLDYCTYSMPQVYWMQATNSGQQLIRTVREYQSMTPYRPIIPTGSAFREFGWTPTVPEVIEFMQTAKSLNLTGVNFWEWTHARTRIPGMWEAIHDFRWDPVSDSRDIAERYIAALNTRNAEEVTRLYAPMAVHITAQRSIQGIEAIRDRYTTLFETILPGATFTLTGYTGAKNSRHLTWTAVSNKGQVNNGNDTFGLISDKIAYHYSFFSVTEA
jgi:hypothetical protein